ncbi:hypothetical protein EHQ76_09110 [Leptospira barantonii]|uniref:Uncharacterized protein n=1 Tax=Leptospira barantonii TaxID=2023184 RepID=A0A5F2BE81_9LEPT|nr:hypothetical protein [Leptospira barantonii]TGM03792.1 hypothetical protein EHQ76_09110 [Leptospira barantonii]
MFPFTYKNKIRLAKKYNNKERILSELREEFSKIGIEDFEIIKDGLKIPSQFTRNKKVLFNKSNAVGFLNECEIFVKENSEDFYFEYCISFSSLFSMSIILLPLSVLAILMNGLLGFSVFLIFSSIPVVVFYFVIMFQYLDVLFKFKK